MISQSRYAVAVVNALKLTIDRSLEDETVKIFVGTKDEKSTPFVVQKGILSRYPYFEKALCGKFREAAKGILHLPEDSKSGWTIVLHYLFRNSLPSPQDIDREFAAKGDSEDLGPFYSSLAHAYVLGDKYAISGLQNCIMRTFLDVINERYLTGTHILNMAEILPTGSPLRSIVLQETVVLVEEHNEVQWTEVDGLVDGLIRGDLCGDTFAELMAYHAEYFRAIHKKKEFPKHEYGKNEAETAKYMVKE